MSKKPQPDPKTRTIKHINKDEGSTKEYAYLKSKHFVDTESSNNTFGNMTITFTSSTDDNTDEYKITNHNSTEEQDGE